MTSQFVFLSFFTFFALASSTTGITQTVRNDVQPYPVPEYCPPQCLPYAVPQGEVPSTIERPPTSGGPSDRQPPHVVHTYHIFKTILKPQMFRQMVTIPYLQRYIRYFEKPIIETVHIQREIPF